MKGSLHWVDVFWHCAWSLLSWCHTWQHGEYWKDQDFGGKAKGLTPECLTESPGEAEIKHLLSLNLQRLLQRHSWRPYGHQSKIALRKISIGLHSSFLHNPKHMNLQTDADANQERRGRLPIPKMQANAKASDWRNLGRSHQRIYLKELPSPA